MDMKIHEKRSDVGFDRSIEEEDDDENFVNQLERTSRNRQNCREKSAGSTVRVNHLTILKSEIPSEAKTCY